MSGKGKRGKGKSSKPPSPRATSTSKSTSTSTSKSTSTSTSKSTSATKKLSPAQQFIAQVAAANREPSVKSKGSKKKKSQKGLGLGGEDSDSEIGGVKVFGPKNYEEHHLAEIKALRAFALDYDGLDPIKPWLDVVYYMDEYINSPEKNLSLLAKKMYCENLRIAADKFYRTEQYLDDPRYIALYMKALRTRGMPAIQERRLLVAFLKVGHGKYSLALYHRLTKLYIEAGDPARAITILQRARLIGAEPSQLIEIFTLLARKIMAMELARRLSIIPLDDEGRVSRWDALEQGASPRQSVDSPSLQTTSEEYVTADEEEQSEAQREFVRLLSEPSDFPEDKEGLNWDSNSSDGSLGRIEELEEDDC